MPNIVRRSTGETLPVRREPSPFFGPTSPLRTIERAMDRMMEDLMSWDPFRTMAPVSSLFEPLFGRGLGFVPTFEVKETSDAFVFKADLPGVKESDLDISLSGDRLTISGKRESEEREEGETWYAYERSYGSFTRSFTLPAGADPDHIDADLRDGVLTLTVAKRPEAQPKKIEVKAKGVIESAVEKVKGALGKEKGEPAKA